MDYRIDLGRIQLFWHAISETGLVRPNNEDSCGFFIPPTSEELSSMGALAVVADGMGGHARGERASQVVMECVGRTYYGTRGPERGEALIEAVREANRALIEEENVLGIDMGSTCSALVFCHESVYAAHVGDSRIYRLRGGTLDQLTNDDSLVAEMVRRGVLTEEDARHHPDRSVLLNALGQKEEMSVSAASTPCELRDGDRYLVCSDGLHGLVDESEIQDVLASHPSSRDAAESLLRLALDRGGIDNISAIVATAEQG